MARYIGTIYRHDKEQREETPEINQIYRIPGAPEPEIPGGYFLVKDYWGCAAGWGRIFTTGLNIMGLHF